MTIQDTGFLRGDPIGATPERKEPAKELQCIFGAVSLGTLSGDLALGLAASEANVDIHFVKSGTLRDPQTEALIDVAGAVVVIPGTPGPMPLFVGGAVTRRIRIERSAAETFVPHALDAVRIFPSRSRLDRAAEAFVGVILEQPARPASAIESYATEQILLELTGSILLDHCGASGDSSLTSVLRDQAMAVIAQRCADRELNPEAVAKAVQSSLRRVQAAFADVGNSIAAEIRRQRGRLARTLLTDNRYDILSVQQIAEQTGFGTTAALRRALDELYGCGPKDLRERRTGIENLSGR